MMVRAIAGFLRSIGKTKHGRVGLDLIGNRDGASAMEFALVLPVLMLALFAIIKFGIVLNNDVELTSGARAAVRVFSVSRGSATAWTDGLLAFQNSAPNAPTASMTVLVNGTKCTDNGSCKTALNTQGVPVSVTATLPCDLTVMAINFASGCTIRAQTTERVE